MYQSCDCLINPSIYEGMPNVVLEAMACGVPVIASDIMGNHDLVINSQTGFIFDLNRPQDLLKSMIEMIENKNKREEMGKNAREYVMKNYSWHSVARQYEMLLLEHTK